MKHIVSSSLRAAALAATLFVLPAFASAKETAPAADKAATLLATTGSVPVSQAGPYVETGTFRIQVLAKLGHPSTTLPDGTMLYRRFAVAGTDARGTLVVRFAEGRVRELTLASPVVVAALLEAAKSSTAVARVD